MGEGAQEHDKRRRVGRCPKGCRGLRVAPLDQALGLVPHQRTGAEVQWMGCLLAVFVPYEKASRLLRQLTGVELAVGTLWGWVQQVGQRAMVQLEGELEALAAGELPAIEPLAAELEALPRVIGADADVWTLFVNGENTRFRRHIAALL